MNRNSFLLIILLIFFTGYCLYGVVPAVPAPPLVSVNQKDSLPENQILYNGKMWRNLYSRVKEDQFLFSGEFLPGSVTINGKTFTNVNIKYDIYEDELLTPKGNGVILKLNKEMVDSFTIIFQNRTYQFTNIQKDSVRGLNGYFNVLNKGKACIYVRYKKEIDLLAVEDKYDVFFMTHKIYFIKDGIDYLITGKQEFFNLMDDYKVQIKSFVKNNRLKVSKKNPDSFVPVVKFYNSLRE